MSAATPDQVGTVFGLPLNASDIINAIVTAEGEATTQILNIFGSGAADISAASKAFGVLGLATSAVPR